MTQDEINAIATAAANSVWDELVAEARVSGSYGAAVGARLDVAVSTRASGTDLTTVLGLVDDLEARITAARALLLDNLDVAVSTRATPADVSGGAGSAPVGAVS